MEESRKPAELVGQTLLGKLRVVRKLGGGGMGAVYEVEHLLTGHFRALKVVALGGRRPASYERILREASVAGRLATPYVVETFDAGTLEDGSAYLLQERLEGRSLLAVLEGDGRLAVERVAAIMVQMCEGLSVAHDAGIIHRDLKPENVFLVGDGEGVKILDFGISKFTAPEAPSRLTSEGTVLGTPYYMSPEQAAGEAIDVRSDVYALGVMMYEAVSGRLPFEARTVASLFVKIAAGECLPLRTRCPDVDPDFAAIVHQAMHRNPEKRHPSVEALRGELLLFAPSPSRRGAKTISDAPDRGTRSYEETVTPRRAETLSLGVPPSRRGEVAPKPERFGTFPPPVRKRRPGLWVGAVTLVLALGGAAWWWSDGGPRGDGDPSASDDGQGTVKAPGAESPASSREANAMAHTDGPEPSVDPAGSETPPAAGSPAAAPESAAESAAETGRTVDDAGSAMRPRRPRVTPAQAAGLDPNPYGAR